jgi:hypothetical protein
LSCAAELPTWNNGRCSLAACVVRAASTTWNSAETGGFSARCVRNVRRGMSFTLQEMTNARRCKQGAVLRKHSEQVVQQVLMPIWRFILLQFHVHYFRAEVL